VNRTIHSIRFDTPIIISRNPISVPKCPRPNIIIFLIIIFVFGSRGNSRRVLLRAHPRDKPSKNKCEERIAQEDRTHMESRSFSHLDVRNKIGFGDGTKVHR
jgi:hypothetical protein